MVKIPHWDQWMTDRALYYVKEWHRVLDTAFRENAVDRRLVESWVRQAYEEGITRGQHDALDRAFPGTEGKK